VKSAGHSTQRLSTHTSFHSLHKLPSTFPHPLLTRSLSTFPHPCCFNKCPCLLRRHQAFITQPLSSIMSLLLLAVAFCPPPFSASRTPAPRCCFSRCQEACHPLHYWLRHPDSSFPHLFSWCPGSALWVSPIWQQVRSMPLLFSPHAVLTSF
jgi:hypothetical protein